MWVKKQNIKKLSKQSMKKYLLIISFFIISLYGGKSKTSLKSDPFEVGKCPQDVLELYQKYCDKKRNPSDTIALAIYYHIVKSRETKRNPAAKNREEYDALSEEKQERIKQSFMQFQYSRKILEKEERLDQDIKTKISFIMSYNQIISSELLKTIQSCQEELQNVDKKRVCGQDHKEQSQLWRVRQRTKKVIKEELLRKIDDAILFVQNQYASSTYYSTLMLTSFTITPNS